MTQPYTRIRVEYVCQAKKFRCFLSTSFSVPLDYKRHLEVLNDITELYDLPLDEDLPQKIKEAELRMLDYVRESEQDLALSERQLAYRRLVRLRSQEPDERVNLKSISKTLKKVPFSVFSKLPPVVQQDLILWLEHGSKRAFRRLRNKGLQWRVYRAGGPLFKEKG